jgi:flavin reductase (DIM6/NTAB) family NADH-FMN oxidoreductase RutF
MTGSFSTAEFREALAHFASGVTIITARAEDAPVGFTASAFTSVSLAPPLVLVCIAKTASAHDAVVAAEQFGVSVLGEGQGWIAEQFARHGVDRFQGVPLREDAVGGVPFIDGALVHLECRRHVTHTAGDHTILIGEVQRGSTLSGRPLVHFARRLGGFVAQNAPRASSPAKDVSNGGES